jgi:TusA-related sulfurtransferase
VSAALAAVAVDGADLTVGGGLLALVRPALDLIAPGGVLAVLSSSPQVREDLPSWCRLERHEYLGADVGPEGRDRHLIRRGTFSVPQSPSGHGDSLPHRADPRTGFAPRDARVEPGGPAYPFTLVERDHVAPPEVRSLYDQAVGAQWEAARDIPWDTIGRLPDAIENAVVQVMSFLAENELSALYVPARFLPRIHPAYAEVAMFLATQLADEARHIDVFQRRARRAAGVPAISSAATARSLLSLMESEDFTEATFLLSVLGEGTFLDLLRFVEEHAPDPATAELCRRARVDETRHVHFGLAHVRHALQHDPALFARLEGAVRRRAATLHGVGGVPAPLQDALILLAARGTDPRAVARGHDDFRALLDTMHEARLRRLRHAGFSDEQAALVSGLHTPNFM